MDGMVFLVPIAFIIGATTVLAPITRAFAKRMEARALPRVPDEVNQRLERMEHAIDAIAVEVERIAEGQRFTTRLLSEARPAAGLPPGPRH